MNTYEELKNRDKELSDKIYELGNNTKSLLRNLIDVFGELFPDEFRILQRDFNEVSLYNIPNRLEVIKDDIKYSKAEEMIKNNAIRSIDRVKEEIIKNNELSKQYDNELLDLMINENPREKDLVEKQEILKQKIKELDTLDGKIETHGEIAYSGLVESAVKSAALRIVNETANERETVKRAIYNILKDSKDDLVLFDSIAFSEEYISNLMKRIDYDKFEEMEKENNKEYKWIGLEKKKAVVNRVKKEKEESGSKLVVPKKIEKVESNKKIVPVYPLNSNVEETSKEEQMEEPTLVLPSANIEEEIIENDIIDDNEVIENVIDDLNNTIEDELVQNDISNLYEIEQVEELENPVVDEELEKYQSIIPEEQKQVRDVHQAQEKLKEKLNFKKIGLGLLTIGSNVVSLLTNSLPAKVIAAISGMVLGGQNVLEEYNKSKNRR